MNLCDSLIHDFMRLIHTYFVLIIHIVGDVILTDTKKNGYKTPTKPVKNETRPRFLRFKSLEKISQGQKTGLL